MAQQQAARLASRMQRELKMLASDPPPGVCAWPLHSHLLTRLQAQIQGPQGTVYAGGIFKLDIEVPDRYPFEPPSIRFLTRVYHPNVDNGGRICLDILNAPPKGAWRPSLNLSTLLASIGLLLAEPNPDDGLMVDITAEYKHDRPTFDTKARRWTELYATNDGLKQTGALDDVQQAESLKDKGFPLPEPMQKKHHARMNVFQEQANEVIDKLGNDTVGPRKKRSLEGDLEDQASPVPIKGKDYLKENKISMQPDPKDGTWFVTKINDSKDKNLSLQSDPKGVTSSLLCKDTDSQEQRRMMGAEKENQTPNKCLDSLPCVSRVNCYNLSQACDDNMEISAPQVMETFSEGMPVSTGEVPSRSKSLKLSRTRLDMQSSKIQQTNSPRTNEKPSRHPGEVPQCNEKTSSQINCHVVAKDAQTLLLPAQNDNGMNTASTKMLQMTSKGKLMNYDADLPTIVVSDSGSDDELSDEDFPLSLTQRSFICKRKANSKLR